MTKARNLLTKFVISFSAFLLFVSSVYAQQSFSLTGRFGLNYRSRNPFLKEYPTTSFWQKILTLNLKGFVLDPRFVLFSISGDYFDNDTSLKTIGADMKNIGYYFSTQFFPKGKLSFVLRYGKRQVNIKSGSLSNLSFKSHYLEKGFDVYLNRIKILPSIWLNYNSGKYTDDSDESRNNIEDKIELIADKNIGKTQSKLNLRKEDYKNQFFRYDRSSRFLNILERIEFTPGTSLQLNGIFSDFTTKISTGSEFWSSSKRFSSHLTSSINPKLYGSLTYNFSLFSADGYDLYSHFIGTSLNFRLRRNLTVSPGFSYARQAPVFWDGENANSSPQAGVNASYNTVVQKVRVNTNVGLYYGQTQTPSSKSNSFFKSGYLGINFGQIRTMEVSLSYSYSERTTDSAVPEITDDLLRLDIGRKRYSHSARFNLVSKAVRSLDLRVFSYLNKFTSQFLFQGEATTRSLDSGISMRLHRFSLSGSYGLSYSQFKDDEAQYSTYSAVLGMNIGSGLTFHASVRRSFRQDFIFSDNYQMFYEAHLNYHIGKFTFSVSFRRFNGKFADEIRKSEIIYIRLTRHFKVF